MFLTICMQRELLEPTGFVPLVQAIQALKRHWKLHTQAEANHKRRQVTTTSSQQRAPDDSQADELVRSPASPEPAWDVWASSTCELVDPWQTVTDRDSPVSQPCWSVAIRDSPGESLMSPRITVSWWLSLWWALRHSTRLIPSKWCLLSQRNNTSCCELYIILLSWSDSWC